MEEVLRRVCNVSDALIQARKPGLGIIDFISHGLQALCGIAQFILGLLEALIVVIKPGVDGRKASLLVIQTTLDRFNVLLVSRIGLG
jgi:hypothetical protein